MNISLNVYELVGWKDAIGRERLETMELYRLPIGRVFTYRRQNNPPFVEKNVRRST